MSEDHIKPPVRKGPRTELKFRLHVAEARQLMSAWQEELDPDPHVAHHDEPMYRVHSIYFDTPQRHALRRDGFPKHRLRQYDDADTRYLEEKFSRGQAVWKRRIPFSNNDLSLLDDESTGPLPPDPYLAWFSQRFRTLQLKPLVHVTYDRIALVGDNGLRITCDFAPRASLSSAAETGAPLTLLEEEAILEVKSEGLPEANGALTQPFLNKLAREATSFSKYAQGVRRLESGSPTSHEI